jgi:putative glutamine amidotransferase
LGVRTTIGITGPDRGGLIAWLMTALAVKRCGAKPVRITATRPRDASTLDGVIIGGGTDVDPFHYGEEPQAEGNDDGEQNSALDWLVGLLLGLVRVLFARHSLQDYDPDRDRMETHLIQHALYNKLPVLGICRGAQLMNVVLGGSLHQQITDFYTEETSNIRSVLPRKTVDVATPSLLQQVLQMNTCRVNALHDQSINKLGDDIQVSARESTGVIQAIERHGHPFFIGVQWHPEYMPQSATQQKLFRSLVASAVSREHHVS